MGGDWHLFEGLTFRNTNIAIEAGMKGIAGSIGLAVKHSRFEELGVAIHSDWSGSRSFYIADNEMIGKREAQLMGWYNIPPWNEQPDFEQKRILDSYYAVAITVRAMSSPTTMSLVSTMQSTTPPTACRTTTPIPRATGCRYRSTSTATMCRTSTTTASKPMAQCTTCGCSTIAAST
jgi:hypothetical protein